MIPRDTYKPQPIVQPKKPCDYNVPSQCASLIQNPLTAGSIASNAFFGWCHADRQQSHLPVLPVNPSRSFFPAGTHALPWGAQTVKWWVEITAHWVQSQGHGGGQFRATAENHLNTCGSRLGCVAGSVYWGSSCPVGGGPSVFEGQHGSSERLRCWVGGKG